MTIRVAVDTLATVAPLIDKDMAQLRKGLPEGAKILLEMQVRATIGVIVAMTSLTMLAVQDAINAILGAVRDFVNGAIGFALV